MIGDGARASGGSGLFGAPPRPRTWQTASGPDRGASAVAGSPWLCYALPLPVAAERNDRNPTTPLSITAAGGIERAARSALVLLLHHRDGVEAVPLPPGQSVTVGRAAPADVRIADASLSRRHARFSREEGGVFVEDLGSTNGTYAGGERVARARVEPGSEVHMGAVTAVIHASGDTGSPALGAAGHEAFRTALQDEITRARFFRRPCAVVTVRALAPHDVPAHRWIQQVRERLRPVDRLALYGPGIAEILLPETPGAEAASRAREIAAAASGEASLACGVATFPDGETTAEALVAASLDAARAATASEPVVLAAAQGARSLGGGADTGAPIAESPAMQALLRDAARLARSSIAVLLQGETGTGKEVLARYVHEQSPRRKGPLISVNCGAIAQSLLESTLFGHERGAFTGAAGAQKGVFEAASGGTVFLDEIGELPPPAQAALLRVLETKRITRVGSTREIEVDVRIVAATHRDLWAMSERGELRQDLYFRLNVAALSIPPLRERREDIAALAALFLKRANEQNGASVRGIDEAAIAVLEGYPWPGNVRELRNAIDRAVVLAGGPVLTIEDLPERVRAASIASGEGPAPASERRGAGAGAAVPAGPGGLKERLAQVEEQMLLEALRASGYRQAEAAKQLLLPLRTLQYKLKQYGIRKSYERSAEGEGDDG